MIYHLTIRKFFADCRDYIGTIYNQYEDAWNVEDIRYLAKMTIQWVDNVGIATINT